MKYWSFQGVSHSAKVSQQEITELTDLAAGLIAFEKAYLTTHGERTPVFRLLSMVNRMIAENIVVIERRFIDGGLIEKANESTDLPF